MRRVKKGFWMELPRDAEIAVGVTAREHDGWLRLEQSTHAQRVVPVGFPS